MNPEKALSEVDKEIKRVLCKKDIWLKKLFKDSRIIEGKHLRARLFFLFSQSAAKESIKIATAIEILHMATLIHDDILDESCLRRHNKPVYLKWGTPAGVLYGDWLFSNGFSLLSELKNPLINKEVVSALSVTLNGELHQRYRKGCLNLSEREYLSIIKEKSGVLFAVSCKIGALIKGLENVYVQRAFNFGSNLGIAYQILDDTADYLDFDEGKVSFRDLGERVVTLPLIYLFRKCSAGEKYFIKRLFKSSKVSRNDIKRLIYLMKRYKAIEDSLLTAKGFFYEAAKSSKENLICSFNEPVDVLSWIGAKFKDIERACCESGGWYR